MIDRKPEHSIPLMPKTGITPHIRVVIAARRKRDQGFANETVDMGIPWQDDQSEAALLKNEKVREVVDALRKKKYRFITVRPFKMF